MCTYTLVLGNLWADATFTNKTERVHIAISSFRPSERDPHYRWLLPARILPRSSSGGGALCGLLPRHLPVTQYAQRAEIVQPAFASALEFKRRKIKTRITEPITAADTKS